MGQQYEAVCKECGQRSTTRVGGGFFFHLLHCDLCGNEKPMSFDEIGEPHLRYLKGLEDPYSLTTRERDEQIRQIYSGDPISEAEYREAVENFAGKCECGGRFKLDAQPRCPACKSSEMDIVDSGSLYD